MSHEQRFDAEVWLHQGGSWWFVTVPEDESEEIRMLAGPPRGFGSVRVEATIGHTTWRTSVFPDKERFVLPLKKAVRVAEQLDDGRPVEVVLNVIDRDGSG